MEEGWPLPFPFPWSIPPSATLSRAELLTKVARTSHLQAASTAFVDTVETEARNFRNKFGVPLPPIANVELHLIEGIAEVVLPIDGKPVKTLAVIYPPEFLFILDVGLDCRVGGMVTWEPVGHGDPGFPEKKKIALRSIAGNSQSHLIFPRFAGSLIIGVRDGTPENEVRQGLTKHGIQDIEFYDFFATGNCRPFEEPTICAELESSFTFVKYAESNSIQRLIDFSPGWFAKRLV